MEPPRAMVAESVQLIQEPQRLSRACELIRTNGKRVALVPTMGALHRGHLTLVKRAREHADVVLVSIFVNPTQFGPDEDLARYPRELMADVEKSTDAGADIVFAPEALSMYPPGEQTRILPGALAERLCGASRPGHFAGVCTIVSKLLHVVGRSCAVFGKKDYQQFKIVERMVKDLFLPVELIAHPTVREKNGLALSSRNDFLSAQEREAALALCRGLNQSRQRFLAGERDVVALQQPCVELLKAAELRTDYVKVVHPETLDDWPSEHVGSERALLAVAAFAGKTRLIDNLVLGEDPEIRY